MEARPYCEECGTWHWPVEGHAKCCEECPGDDTCEHHKVCMCGDSMSHSPWSGHSPVSMHDYHRNRIRKMAARKTAAELVDDLKTSAEHIRRGDVIDYEKLAKLIEEAADKLASEFL